MEVRDGQLRHPQVIALLEEHAAGMLANSPAESCHFLDLSGLDRPDVSFWTLWDGDALLGMGALKAIDARHGEVKSMRTSDGHINRGVGAAMLVHIIAVARERGYARLSLETGTAPAFAPATRLYERHGFVPCDAFADYPANDPHSRFLTLTL